jgi:hypothetical protein
MNPEAPICAHAGDAGDIIHGLCAVKALARRHGPLPLTLFKSAPGATTHPMTRQRAGLLRPLIEAQPYISELRYSEAPVRSALNDFRHFSGGWGASTIADAHLLATGGSLLERNEPWLTVADPVTDYPILFHRSHRYQNGAFPWPRIVEKYGSRARFIGLPNEHADFCAAFGHVEYLPTKDFGELARVIAGCRLYIGNQSSPFGIAEGLKKRAILEVCPEQRHRNCEYPRLDVIHGHDGTIGLPEL